MNGILIKFMKGSLKKQNLFDINDSEAIMDKIINSLVVGYRPERKLDEDLQQKLADKQ